MTAPSILLTMPEAAEALRVSRGTIYRMAQERVIPTVTIRGRLRVPRAELERWVERQARYEGAA